MNVFLLKTHKIKIGILAGIFYIPLFLYLMTERDTNDLIQAISLFFLRPFFLMSQTIPFGIFFLYLLNLAISFLLASLVVLLWEQYITSSKKRIITGVLLIGLLISWQILSFVGLRVHLPPRQCDFQIGLVTYGDQIQTKSYRCLVENAFESNDGNVCFLLDDPYECILIKAKELHTPDLCLKLKKQWQQEVCLDNIQRQ